MLADKITIPLDVLPSLNEHDNANRANRFGGASMKKKATRACEICIRNAMNKGFKFNNQPTDFVFTWYAKDRRRDKDNISFARKYIFDGMIKAGLTANDGWKEIGNWEDIFEIDKENPRVEIRERKLNK